MEADDLIKILSAYYKDKVEKEIYNDLYAGMMHLLEAEADCRRAKAKADIMQMAKLKIALSKFEYSYNKLKQDTGNIEAIDKYIKGIECQIKSISARKNHGYA